MQRALTARLAPFAAAALATSLRHVGSRPPVNPEEPGSKKAKVNLDDDDRWLEAEFDEKLRSPEERYAHERQRQVMKALMQKVRNEHDEKLQTAVDERNAKVEGLQSQIRELTEKLNNLTKS